MVGARPTFTTAYGPHLPSMACLRTLEAREWRRVYADGKRANSGRRGRRRGGGSWDCIPLRSGSYYHNNSAIGTGRRRGPNGINCGRPTFRKTAFRAAGGQSAPAPASLPRGRSSPAAEFITPAGARRGDARPGSVDDRKRPCYDGLPAIHCPLSARVASIRAQSASSDSGYDSVRG